MIQYPPFVILASLSAAAKSDSIILYSNCNQKYVLIVLSQTFKQLLASNVTAETCFQSDSYCNAASRLCFRQIVVSVASMEIVKLILNISYSFIG
jgi:hypothetical protein